MTPTQIAGLVVLAALAFAWFVYLRERRIMRRMSEERVEQILEHWSKIERSKRGLNGRFVHKSMWDKEQI